MTKLTITLLFCTSLAVAKDAKPAKTKVPAPGVKTPGILIPYGSLKSDAEIALEVPPTGFLFTDAIAFTGDAGILRFDAKTNKPFEPTRDIAGVEKPCGGLLNALTLLPMATVVQALAVPSVSFGSISHPDSTVHAVLQQSPALALPSSHVSPPSLTPSPQIGVHMLGVPEHE